MENSKTNEPHKFVLCHEDSNKHVAFQNLYIYYIKIKIYIYIYIYKTVKNMKH